MAKHLALDIGASVVRVAEVETKGSDTREGATLLGYGEKLLPPGIIRDGVIEEPVALSAVIKEAVNLAKPSTKKTTIGLGHHSVMVREVDIPAQKMDELRKNLAFHVQDVLPMSPDDALMDFYPTSEVEGPNGKNLRGLLVAAQKEMVRDLITVTDKAGLKVTNVDHAAFGVWRSVARGALQQGNVAFVDVGHSVTTVIITETGVVRLVRVLPQASSDANKAIANALGGGQFDIPAIKHEIGMDFNVRPEHRPIAEAANHAMSAVIDGVRNTTAYFASTHAGGHVERIVLTGGGCYMRGFGQQLASQTGVQVLIGEPLLGVRIGKKVKTNLFQGREAQLATVVGLGMGGGK